MVPSLVEVYTDGCSLGNPGRAGAGAVLYKNKKTIKKISEYLGTSTNNVAEYTGLILGLQEVLNLKEKNVVVYMDSELVVNQMKGIYKVRDKNLYVFHVLVKHLAGLLDNCQFKHKNREYNEVADSLAKRAAGSRRCKEDRG